MVIQSSKIPTSPFPGQKPGTSGLRKKIVEFRQEHYMENFIQCTLSAMGSALEGCTLVVGGDGRFGLTEAVDLIIKMAAANKVNCTYYKISRTVSFMGSIDFTTFWDHK